MRNLKLTIEYDGADYAGWQRQKSHHVIPRLRSGQARSPRHQCKTIQETIEAALQKILQEKVRLIASGRTDAGVHALCQVANFKTTSDISLPKLQRGLNALLSDDIVIKKIEEVSPHFHSRFCAKSKVYRYTILNQPHRSAFLKNKAYFYPYPLDIGLIRKEAKCLVGKHNFKSFCASGNSAKDTVRTISNINIKQLSYHLLPKTYHLKESPLIIIDIEADGFLYNMVRNIAGTLLEIGRGKLPKASLKQILKAKDRKLAGPTAPSCGLSLLTVKY